MGWKGVEMDEVEWNGMKQGETMIIQEGLSWMEQSELEWTRVKWSENWSQWWLWSCLLRCTSLYFTPVHPISLQFTPFHPGSSWLTLFHSISYQSTHYRITPTNVDFCLENPFIYPWCVKQLSKQYPARSQTETNTRKTLRWHTAVPNRHLCSLADAGRRRNAITCPCR